MHKKSLVVIKEGQDKCALLLDVVTEAGLFDRLEKVFSLSGKKKDDFKIAVKPNFMVLTSKLDPTCFTNTKLVVTLLEAFLKRGFTNLHVVESQNVLGQWYKNRSVAAVAAHAGYKEDFYKVHDLTLDNEPHDFKETHDLHKVGTIWKEADFRISFGKNKTHPAGVYTLSLKNIFGCTTGDNKYLVYHKFSEWDTVTVAMLAEFPVHFGIVDAITSADGWFGFRGSKRIKHTNTIIASHDLIALDWAGALKMGLNPMRSRLMKKVVKKWGKPDYTVSGPLTPYREWRNTPYFLPYFDDYLEEWYTAHSFFTHLIMLPPDPDFPEPHAWFYKTVRAILGLKYKTD